MQVTGTFHGWFQLVTLLVIICTLGLVHKLLWLSSLLGRISSATMLLMKKRERNPNFPSGWGLKQNWDVSQHVNIPRVSQRKYLEFYLSIDFTYLDSQNMWEDWFRNASLNFSEPESFYTVSFLFTANSYWVGYTQLPSFLHVFFSSPWTSKSPLLKYVELLSLGPPSDLKMFSLSS